VSAVQTSEEKIVEAREGVVAAWAAVAAESVMVAPPTRSTIRPKKDRSLRRRSRRRRREPC